MTNQPEGREPCPELAETWYAEIHPSGEILRVYRHENRMMKDDQDAGESFTFVQAPVEVRPLLTADEREKLIGERK